MSQLWSKCNVLGLACPACPVVRCRPSNPSIHRPSHPRNILLTRASVHGAIGYPATTDQPKPDQRKHAAELAADYLNEPVYNTINPPNATPPPAVHVPVLSLLNPAAVVVSAAATICAVMIYLKHLQLAHLHVAPSLPVLIGISHATAEAGGGTANTAQHIRAFLAEQFKHMLESATAAVQHVPDAITTLIAQVHNTLSCLISYLHSLLARGLAADDLLRCQSWVPTVGMAVAALIGGSTLVMVFRWYTQQKQNAARCVPPLILLYMWYSGYCAAAGGSVLDSRHVVLCGPTTILCIPFAVFDHMGS